MTRSLVWALALLCGIAASAAAQTPVVPSQGGNTKNQEVASASSAAVSVTLTATAQTRARLYSAAARCSAGTASLTVTDGGTTRWTSDATFIGTATKSAAWIPPFVGTVGQAVVITLGSCGGGNTGTLDVQGDVF